MKNALRTAIAFPCGVASPVILAKSNMIGLGFTLAALALVMIVWVGIDD
jgi:hypothetical protein